MLKVLTQEIKELTTWKEAADWLATHGWGSGLIEEQKLLWEEFKKTGTDSANIMFDIITGTTVLVKETAPEKASVAPVKAGK